MQKLYCYVDESGQDTEGKLFLVSVVVLDRDRELIQQHLGGVERRSCKGNRKWFHTNEKRRLAYIGQYWKISIFVKQFFIRIIPRVRRILISRYFQPRKRFCVNLKGCMKQLCLLMDSNDRNDIAFQRV